MKNTLTKEQINFLRKGTKNCQSKWSFNEKTGLVDIEGSFDISEKRLETFQGIKFGVVTGSFVCSINELTSLEGAPQKVGEDFECHSNELTSLEGAPQKVGGSFDCSFNQLTSLEGAPQKVGKSFLCSNNKLTSLEGAPQKVGESFCCARNKLKSLEGAPQEVKGNFYCEENQLTSLEGAPQKAGGDFECKNNLIGDELLGLIWKRIKSCPNYKIAINSVRNEILNSKQKELDKINSKYEILFSQLDDDDDLSNGASILGRIGVF